MTQFAIFGWFYMNLVDFSACSYSVTTNPTDPRLIVVTLPIAQFASPSSASNAVGVVGFSYARATLLLSPEYPREDCFVHLIAQLEGGPPLTADALLSIQVLMLAYHLADIWSHD